MCSSDLPVPLDAYWTLRPIVSIPWQPPKQQDQAFARIEQNLREQMAREPSSEGKRLIQNALVNFAKMKRLREMVWDKKFPFETFRHMMLDLNRYFLDKWEDLDEALMVGAKGKR